MDKACKLKSNCLSKLSEERASTNESLLNTRLHSDGGQQDWDVGCRGIISAEFEAEAESQLVFLDFPVSVDVAVAHQGFPELVQFCSADAGLQVEMKNARVKRTVNHEGCSLD